MSLFSCKSELGAFSHFGAAIHSLGVLKNLKNLSGCHCHSLTLKALAK
jgi:hypothetical protein